MPRDVFASAVDEWPLGRHMPAGSEAWTLEDRMIFSYALCQAAHIHGMRQRPATPTDAMVAAMSGAAAIAGCMRKTHAQMTEAQRDFSARHTEFNHAP